MACKTGKCIRVLAPATAATRAYTSAAILVSITIYPSTTSVKSARAAAPASPKCERICRESVLT
jgi:hypothetical protein